MELLEKLFSFGQHVLYARIPLRGISGWRAGLLPTSSKSLELAEHALHCIQTEIWGGDTKAIPSANSRACEGCQAVTARITALP